MEKYTVANMPAGLVHEKDKYGNDMYFGHPKVRFPVMPYVKDFYQQVKDIKDLELRPDDVITVAYPKSGVNWANHITTMLLDGSLTVPPIFSPSNYIHIDVVSSEIHIPPPLKPRALWSHVPFRFLPRDVTEKSVKVVYITRNPKDVFVSLYCHLQNFDGTMGYSGTWPQFFEVMLEQGYWHGDLFEYLKDWEREIENHPDQPILHVSFENMKQDPVGNVERLNEFLGTQRSQQFCRDVAHECRFSNMHVTRQFDLTHALDSANWREDTPMSSFFRKGKVGDWKNWFTVAQNEQFDKVYRAKMADSKLRFTFQ